MGCKHGTSSIDVKYCKIKGKPAGENNIGECDLRDMLGIFYFRITREPLVG